MTQPMLASALKFPSCRLAGVAALLALTACQQPAPTVEGHKVEKTEVVNGVKVNVLAPTDQDRKIMNQEASDMKKSTKDVTFTPGEQQGAK